MRRERRECRRLRSGPPTGATGAAGSATAQVTGANAAYARATTNGGTGGSVNGTPPGSAALARRNRIGHGDQQHHRRLQRRRLCQCEWRGGRRAAAARAAWAARRAGRARRRPRARRPAGGPMRARTRPAARAAAAMAPAISAAPAGRSAGRAPAPGLQRAGDGQPDRRPRRHGFERRERRGGGVEHADQRGRRERPTAVICSSIRPPPGAAGAPAPRPAEPAGREARA